MNFVVVQFDDGVTLVPNNWLTDENMCYWPPTVDKLAINKLVSSKATPESSWKCYKVIRIFCEAATYQRGTEKVKLAIEMSDLDTEDELSKKSRHSRHFKIQSDEEELTPIASRKRRLVQNISDSDSDDGSGQFVSNLPKLPCQPESILRHRKTSLCRTSRFQSISPISSQSDVLSISEIASGKQTREISKVRSPTQTNNQQNEVEIIRKLNFLINATKRIECRLTIIEQSISTIQSNSDGMVVNSAAMSSYKEFKEKFPIKNENELLAFEDQLKDKEFFNTMVVSLSSLGGVDVPNVTVNILKNIISNTVATLYSLHGKKKKKAFKDLNVYTLIIDAVRKQKPGTTESEIAAVIGNWLPQSSLRLSREKRNSRHELLNPA